MQRAWTAGDDLRFSPLSKTRPVYQSFSRYADKKSGCRRLRVMIELTRLNGQAMVVNSDLIKYVESSPDTMLTLIHGEKIVVSEPCAEVVRRISAYRAMLLIDAFGQIPSNSAVDLANTAAGASGLRAMAADHAVHAGELPDGSEDAAQQRRRRSEL
jgi:flagellar protein FlbD